MTQLSQRTQRRVERRVKHIETLVLLNSTIIKLATIASDVSISLLKELLTMAQKTQQELLDEIAILKQAITDDQTADQAVVTGLDGVVAQLRARVAELEAAGIDTEAIFAALEDAKAGIAGVSSTS